jgi:hypothetical protein
MIFNTSLLILAVRGQEQVADLWGPINVCDNAIICVIGVSEGDSVSQDVMATPTLLNKYFSFDFRPYLRSNSIISPSPWSSTFSRNFDERLKKSVKTRDLTTEFSSSAFNSVLNNNYEEFLLAVPTFSHLPFCAVCAPGVAAGQFLFRLLPFL